jgi:hypothetical protein
LAPVAAFTAGYGAKFRKAIAKITDNLDQLLAFYDYTAEPGSRLKDLDPQVLTIAHFSLSEVRPCRPGRHKHFMKSSGQLAVASPQPWPSFR